MRGVVLTRVHGQSVTKMSTYLNLRDFGKKVTTTSVECQGLINHGLLQLFGFNREEAIRCFEKALHFDKNCAMAHYFIAYGNAPYYNNPDGFDLATGFEESRKAMEEAKNGSVCDWEMDLIKAQLQRFCSPPGSQPSTESNKSYVNEMRLVYQKYGKEDVDIAAFFAEALMQLAPWKLWTSPPDYKPAIPETEELTLVLETAIKTSPDHPGLCHFYIHTMELSSTPEKALLAADALRNGLEHGHLLHMASHIDIWVGHYKEAIDINKIAVDVHELYVEKTGHDNDFYTEYRLHNYLFVAWAAMFDGQYATAMKYAKALEKQITVQTATLVVGSAQLGVMFLEPYACAPWHVLIRCGKWEEILNYPIKEEKDVYVSTIATAHYARAVAFAVTGRLKEAEAERSKFYNSLKNETFKDRYLHNNLMHDSKYHCGILDVAEAVMNGEVEYQKGNIEEGFKHLRLAVERDTNLMYDEPWGWMMPSRHVLGALLLEQGRAAEAEVVYHEDLNQYKNNMWSLLGLCQALKQQGKVEETKVTQDLFQKASVRADVNIQASCLCATKICCH